jgi:hypothetical protein
MDQPEQIVLYQVQLEPQAQRVLLEQLDHKVPLVLTQL